jgi:hypothetical protein
VPGPPGPPGPPGAPQQRPERGIPDGLIVGLLALLLGTTALVWAATELGGLVSHGHFPRPLPFLSTAGAIRHLATAPNDLPGAWPGTPAASLPSAAAFWLTFFALLALALLLLLSVATARAKRRAEHARERQRREAEPGARGGAGVGSGFGVGQDGVAAGGVAGGTPGGTGPVGPPGQRRGPGDPRRSEAASVGFHLDAAGGPAQSEVVPPAEPSVDDGAHTQWLDAPPAESWSPRPPGAPADPGSSRLGPQATGSQAPSVSASFGMPSVADPDLWFPEGGPQPRADAPGSAVTTTSGVSVPRPGGATAVGRAQRSAGVVRPLIFTLPASGTMCVFAPEAANAARRTLMRAIVAEAASEPLVVVTADAALWDARPAHRRTVRFDPQQLTDDDPEEPRGRWAPHSGCADAVVAAARARALLLPTVRPVADAEELAVRALAETLLRCWLRAAALDGRPFRHVARWAGGSTGGGSGTGRQEAVAVLQSAASPADTAAGEESWAGQLQAALLQPAPVLEAALGRVRAALGAVAELHVLAACTPESPATALDPAKLLHDGAAGSLYILGRAGDGRLREPAGGVTPAVHSAMPLLSALVDDVVQRAWHRARHARDAGADPTPLLVLDDIAAVAPFPTLPQLMADGGDRGLRAVALLRSPEQARARWGERAVHSLWTNADHRAVLGPLASAPLAALLASVGATEHTVQPGLGPKELLVLAGRHRTAPPQRFRIGPAQG